MTQQTQNQNYFNLIADGFGYINRLREVKPKRGNPFYACTIQALRGDQEDKTRFEVRIVGHEAKELVQKLIAEHPDVLAEKWQDRPTISCAFRIGDIAPVVFETKDKKTGEVIQTPAIDGRLLKFKSIRIDGQVWFTDSVPAEVAEAA